MILVFGKNGQISRALQPLLATKALFLSQEQAPFENPTCLIKILNQHRPTTIINAAAYTLVDRAETEREKCLQINSQAPKEIASWCNQNKAVLIHFSTDYVFSGEGTRPWIETDPKLPINWYGHCKNQADQDIERVLQHHLIFRVSWIYDEIGKNFMNTILKLGQEQQTLRIVNDQFGYPTYSKVIAEIAAHFALLLEGSDRDSFSKWGTYHVSSHDYTNWYEFASCVLTTARSMNQKVITKEIQPIPSSDFPTPAARPLNSRLNSNKLKSIWNKPLPHWKNALEDCLRNKYGSH